MTDFDRLLNDHREQGGMLAAPISAFIEHMPFSRAVRQSIVEIEERMDDLKSKLDDVEEKLESVEGISQKILDRLSSAK